MGDRFEGTLYCAYCNHSNVDVWISPTSNVYGFVCCECRKYNFVTSGFMTKKLEDTTLEDVKNAFLNATSVGWSDEDIERITKRDFEILKEKEVK